MSFIDGTLRPGHDDHIVCPYFMCNACGKKFAETPYGLCTDCRYSWIYTGGIVERQFNDAICSDPDCKHHDGAHVTYGYDYKKMQPLRVCMMFDYQRKKICGCKEFKKAEEGIVVKSK